MKKYRLKKWVENLLFTIEAIIFCSLIFIIEDNGFVLVANKLIGTALFILIGAILIRYGNYDMED